MSKKIFEDFNNDKMIDISEINWILTEFHLSQIYSMEEFYEKTQKLLLKNSDKEYDIISLDVDRFKVINDLYGTDEGNKILRYIAYILNSITNCDYESCGRLYADNFAICKLRQEGYEEKIAEILKKHLDIYPLDINISLCFGIYSVEDRNMSVASMCDRANMALKNVKGSYKKMYAHYEETHRNILLEEQEIINDMNNALKNGEFEVYFQPKYILSDVKLSGAEALVRWMHPKKGAIPPLKFIPIFEKTGFITSMDEYVWEFICKTLRKWIDAGLTVVPISVNVSRIDIYNPNLCQTLKGLIDKYNIPINLLELEITETSYMENPSQLIETVIKLKELGFTVEMDDFGTGYSSLNMLNQVPVDVLKLDLRFMKSVSSSGKSANILNSIVSMARWLDLPVVAEGVETEEQVSFLKSIGCNKGQGYYFSKPMPCNDFEKLLYKSEGRIQAKSYKLPKTFVDLQEFWDPKSQVNVLFNSFVGGLGIFELKGNCFDILRVNDRFYEVIDLDRDTLYKAIPRLQDYIDSEYMVTFYKKLEQAKKENSETTVELKITNAITNKPMYILLRMRVIFNNSERTLFLGSIDNITEEKIARDALKVSEERYEYVMDMTGDIVFEYDFKTNEIINANSFEKEFGKIEVETSLFKAIIDLGIIKDEDLEELTNIFSKMTKGQPNIVRYKLQLKNVSGQYLWYTISARGVYDKDNELVKLIGIISKVDALKNRLM